MLITLSLEIKRFTGNSFQVTRTLQMIVRRMQSNEYVNIVGLTMFFFVAGLSLV